LERPHLEFTDQAWDPWLKKNNEMLENVEMRAVGMISAVIVVTYKKRMQENSMRTRLVIGPLIVKLRARLQVRDNLPCESDR
jgi:hypothetical protein